jgi:uncharacterized protein (DUF58 family)
MKKILSLTVAVGLMAIAGGAFAADIVNIEMKDGKFNPATIDVPVEQVINLKIKNSETVTVEFESDALHREIKIKAGETADISVGPLKAGNYDLTDDSNPDAKGTLIAK